MKEVKQEPKEMFTIIIGPEPRPRKLAFIEPKHNQLNTNERPKRGKM